MQEEDNVRVKSDRIICMAQDTAHKATNSPIFTLPHDIKFLRQHHQAGHARCNSANISVICPLARDHWHFNAASDVEDREAVAAVRREEITVARGKYTLRMRMG
jgi:hypothetical protein